jgi:hypothetical protein
MPRYPKALLTSAAVGRYQAAERTTETAKTLIHAEHEAMRKKTERLKAERLAKVVAESIAEAGRRPSSRRKP